MANFRIIPTLVNKFKKLTGGTLAKKSKESIDWFKNKLNRAFGSGTSDRADWGDTTSSGGAGGRQPPNNNQGTTSAPNDRSRRSSSNSTADDTRRSGSTRRATPTGNSGINDALNRNSTLDATFKKNLKIIKGLPKIGYLYMYVYDPKHKKTLPYYDKFPMVIPINYYDNGWLGLNLHYLSYIPRAKLLDFLFSLKHSRMVKDKEEYFFAVSYPILKALADDDLYKPTIHRYLSAHVRSPLVEVGWDEIENAAFLPVEQFQKQNKRYVWAQNRR